MEQYFREPRQQEKMLISSKIRKASMDKIYITLVIGILVGATVLGVVIPKLWSAELVMLCVGAVVAGIVILLAYVWENNSAVRESQKGNIVVADSIVAEVGKVDVDLHNRRLNMFAPQNLYYVNVKIPEGEIKQFMITRAQYNNYSKGQEVFIVKFTAGTICGQSMIVDKL